MNADRPGSGPRQTRQQIPGPKTLGPVQDLEHHLPSDWWRNLFTSLYLKTDGDVVENQENTRREVDLVISAAALEPNDNLLDLCCGQGRHVIELAHRGFTHVTGVDRSRYLVRLAKKRARSEGLAVNFHEGDARKFRPPEAPFHCALILGNSFGYFERPQDDEAVMNTVMRILSPRGYLLMDIVDGEWMREHFVPRSWEWIDENHFVCRERALAKDGERIVTRELISHAEKGVIADQFYAERLYTRDRIGELLDRCNFQNIRFHEPLETASTRGHDLGMMAHRMILTSQTPSRRTRAVVAKPKSVSVLFGDPSLPDRVKRNGRFNVEDIETTRRLKESLDELDGFTFTYQDNHRELIPWLRTQSPEFVFNLCDEGFWNDPFKELHVPALLDMLEIPYTGAGPASLGLCYNKSFVRSIASSLDVPVPMESFIGPSDLVATIPATFPALIKPNFGDSSFGITKNAVVGGSMELTQYIEWLRSTMGQIPILVQEYLTGTEYSIGIVGNPGLTYKVLPPLEVDYSKLPQDLPPILGYESKWYPDSPYWTDISYRHATLSEDLVRQLVDYSSILFERLGCRDYARFDFRADAEGTVKLLEVNPNPGWCWDGKMNIMAGFKGMRYSDLLRLIIEAALERIAAA